MKSFWKYTAARLALFVVTYYVIWTLVGTRWPVAPIDPFVLLAAIIVSGVLSLFVLRRLREDFAERITHRTSQRAQRIKGSRDSDLD